MVLNSTSWCAIFLLLILNCCTWTNSEVFTAISDVEPLLQTHKKIIDDVNDYIKAEEKRLEDVKKRLSHFIAEHEKAMEDIPNYLGNPINAFTLLKRLTVDLDHMRRHIQNGTVENSKNITRNHDGLRYPLSDDLAGAAEALTRLQKTYKLDVRELSEGMLNGVVCSKPMTSEDCFEIGRALYNAKDYTHSLGWMMEGLRKYKEGDDMCIFNETEFLEYISALHYYLDDYTNALKWTEKIVEINPNHTRAPQNLIIYKEKVEEQKTKKLSEETEGESTKNQAQNEDDLLYSAEFKNYEMLCRGEMELPSVVTKRLKCRYVTESHPFLKLAPIKMEYLHLHPDVIVFHDVMYDDEIKLIQNMAKPRFKRATVQGGEKGALIPAKYRISKSAWLEDYESPVVARVSQRVADMTGLSVASAESLQVVNYGIGGHYEPHYDFTAKGTTVTYDFGGNRIATVLFYMSDVAQGGATVFTKLGLSVFPRKGSAAFWLNLHPSGERDLATRHAACPVLQGSKWVSNKWLHEHSQEFLKPCTLEYQKEGVSRRFPKPIIKTSI